MQYAPTRDTIREIRDMNLATDFWILLSYLYTTYLYDNNNPDIN